MKNLFEIDEWKIVQNQYEPSKQLQAESIFSIGNGSFGHRANFEEHYSGPTLQGNYLGGIYYPDKTKVCLLYTSPSPRDREKSRMPSSA